MIKQFTSNELYQFLYNDDYDQFASKMTDLKLRLKYFHLDNRYWRNDHYVIWLEGDKIVGVLDYAICKNTPTFQGHYHFLSYVSVDHDYRKRGIAKKLIKYWQENVLINDKGVCGCSGFTEEGFNYLKPLLEKIHEIEMDNHVSF